MIIEAQPYGKTDNFSSWYRENYDNLDKIHTLTGTIKIHGTNASVIITPNGIYAQSRNRILTVADDNYGFAKWVSKRSDHFRRVYQELGLSGRVQIYGEFAGKGIQINVGVSEIEKFFYMFPTDHLDYGKFQSRYNHIYDAKMFCFTVSPEDIYQEAKLYDQLMLYTQSVSDNCSVAGRLAMFDDVKLTNTTGEGIVWIDNLGNKFKTKTDAHRGSTDRVVHKEVQKVPPEYAQYLHPEYLQKCFEGLDNCPDFRDNIGSKSVIPLMVIWLAEDFKAEQGDVDPVFIKTMTGVQVQRYIQNFVNKKE